MLQHPVTRKITLRRSSFNIDGHRFSDGFLGLTSRLLLRGDILGLGVGKVLSGFPEGFTGFNELKHLLLRLGSPFKVFNVLSVAIRSVDNPENGNDESNVSPKFSVHCLPPI